MSLDARIFRYVYPMNGKWVHAGDGPLLLSCIGPNIERLELVKLS